MKLKRLAAIVGGFLLIPASVAAAGWWAGFTVTEFLVLALLSVPISLFCVAIFVAASMRTDETFDDELLLDSRLPREPDTADRPDTNGETQ